MPYICVTDPNLTFPDHASVVSAQAEAIASGDLAKINTVHDLAWVPEEGG